MHIDIWKLQKNKIEDSAWRLLGHRNTGGVSSPCATANIPENVGIWKCFFSSALLCRRWRCDLQKTTNRNKQFVLVLVSPSRVYFSFFSSLFWICFSLQICSFLFLSHSSLFQVEARPREPPAARLRVSVRSVQLSMAGSCLGEDEGLRAALFRLEGNESDQGGRPWVCLGWSVGEIGKSASGEDRWCEGRGEQRRNQGKWGA